MNLALNKTTWQSGVTGSYYSSNAVDGDFDPNYQITPHAKTARGSVPWWGVDLEGIYLVLKVKVVVSASEGKLYLSSNIVQIWFINLLNLSESSWTLFTQQPIKRGNLYVLLYHSSSWNLKGVIKCYKLVCFGSILNWFAIKMRYDIFGMFVLLIVLVGA